MAIIEIIGGPITHKYLMGKTKHEIADMYMRLLRETARDAEDAARYRWLKANFSASYHRATSDYWVLNGEVATPRQFFTGEQDLTLDAAIDAARAGERGVSGG